MGLYVLISFSIDCGCQNLDCKAYGSQVGATKNVAWRFHTDNIRCNGVLPGSTYPSPLIVLTLYLTVQVLRQTSRPPCRWNNLTRPGSTHSCMSTEGVTLKADYDSPIVQLHVSNDSEGIPVPVVGVDDVARGIAFLASDDAKMINGAMIPIDNAWSTM